MQAEKIWLTNLPTLAPLPEFNFTIPAKLSSVSSSGYNEKVAINDKYDIDDEYSASQIQMLPAAGKANTAKAADQQIGQNSSLIIHGLFSPGAGVICNEINLDSVYNEGMFPA